MKTRHGAVDAYASPFMTTFGLGMTLIFWSQNLVGSYLSPSAKICKFAEIPPSGLENMMFTH